MDEIKTTKVVVEGVDMFDIVKFIAKKTKLYQATLLSNIEEILGKDFPEYTEIRKLILDSTNNFSRTIIKAIFDEES
jgi:hypothetical protein